MTAGERRRVDDAARRRAVLDMCRRQLARAEADYEAAAWLCDGDDVVRSMAVAVQTGAGGGVRRKSSTRCVHA